ncbi:porin [Bradyrhizobium sp. WYCCWR 13023]|uniref:Porin n=1 Tax=Bradyrhizobium zhengyangense TaxID=2911009 RepID=A0A9X1RFS6_9BRAD|nr:MULTISPECIES: porin [Bradyrhizobium]MCG2631849.1 porin [Bradyrhizobium zhengyangense]MCG2639995.1 porin [Bradyrhizobium zhengyangense]MCG2672644.1 porin [Bradyrhizobium zhengyangense]MDA9523541.1 polymerase [Bradyrhizobium sp. CCBAU 11434]
MKVVKSLLLGTAAGLIAVGGAQAADLPVKAKAVEYVKICSLYGAGFYYMPGTDTCIKFGGYVRADAILGGAGDYGFNNSTSSANGGSNNRLTNYYYSRARLDLNVDTRTATEYGVVRTYADMVFTYDTSNVTGSNPSAISSSSASLGLYHAFIQFAGFTFGRTVSIFDAPWQSYPAGGPDSIPGGSNHVNGVNQVAYTADFGQGITGSLALEDETSASNGQSNLWNVSSGTAAQFVTGVYGANSWGGTRSPDIIGAVRVDQAWGLAQLSVVGHDIHAGYYGATEPSGHPGDKWGWAVQGSLSIKNIPTGAGDSINLQAVYTDGATRYNFQSLFPQSFFMFGGSSSAYQSIGFAGLADGVFGTGTSIDTVKTWGVRGGYTHNWSPNWASAIYGGYASASYGSTGKTLICANFATIAVAGATCNPDFNFSVLGVNTVWTPVKNLAFTADVSWSRLDQKYAGSITAPAIATAAKPAAVYELKDQNSVTMMLRAQRNF